MKKLLLTFAFTAGAAFAQFQTFGFPVSNPLVGSTTLSQAVITTQTQVCLASATGVVVPSLTTGQTGSFLFIDREMAQVQGSGNSATCFRVFRGRNGTPTQQHANGSLVWIGNPATSTGDTSRPIALNLFPMEDASPAPLSSLIPATGSQASTSSAVPVAGSLYITEIAVEHSRPVTGICMLNGSAIGTDNHIFFIYDYAGNLLGQTAATLAANASLYQCLPLLTPIEISGLRSYFIGFQSNGTTATVQKYVTGQVGPTLQAGSQTGVSGTIPTTITPPASFTTATGPLGELY
jgi:hypothetical protein